MIGTIGKNISKAVHLVSIDEKRIVFQPTLFNQDKRILEVWFSGVHSDVGGGYWFDGLSDVTLEFMIDTIKDDLQLLDKNQLNYDYLKIMNSKDSIAWDDINIKPLVEGVLHEQIRSGLKAKTLASRFVRVNKDDLLCQSEIPIIHHSVRDRFNAVASYRPYALRCREFKIINEDRTVSKKVFDGVSSL